MVVALTSWGANVEAHTCNSALRSCELRAIYENYMPCLNSHLEPEGMRPGTNRFEIKSCVEFGCVDFCPLSHNMLETKNRMALGLSGSAFGSTVPQGILLHLFHCHV